MCRGERSKESRAIRLTRRLVALERMLKKDGWKRERKELGKVIKNLHSDIMLKIKLYIESPIILYGGAYIYKLMIKIHIPIINVRQGTYMTIYNVT